MSVEPAASLMCRNQLQRKLSVTVANSRSRSSARAVKSLSSLWTLQPVFCNAQIQPTNVSTRNRYAEKGSSEESARAYSGMTDPKSYPVMAWTDHSDHLRRRWQETKPAALSRRLWDSLPRRGKPRLYHRVSYSAAAADRHAVSKLGDHRRRKLKSCRRRSYPISTRAAA